MGGTSWLEKMELELTELVKERCPARMIAEVIYGYIGDRQESFVERRAVDAAIEMVYLETLGEALTMARIWKQDETQQIVMPVSENGGGV